MSGVISYQFARQFGSSFQLVIVLCLIVAMSMNPSATSSGNTRSSSLSWPFLSRKGYPPNAQKLALRNPAQAPGGGSFSKVQMVTSRFLFQEDQVGNNKLIRGPLQSFEPSV